MSSNLNEFIKLKLVSENMEIEELKQMIEANEAGESIMVNKGGEFIALKIRHFSSVTKQMRSFRSGGAQLSHREKI